MGGSSVAKLLEGLRPLSGISRLTEFGRIPVTVMITLPGHADGVLGRSRRDFGSVLLVARGMPLGDGVKDDLGRERSHLSKVRITNRLALNSLPLRLQVAFRLLQVSYQPVDFCNRRGFYLLNERSNLRCVSFRLRRNLCVSEIADFAFNNQIAARARKFVISSFIR
jgi:hypothetical protein